MFLVISVPRPSQESTDVSQDDTEIVGDSSESTVPEQPIGNLVTIVM